MLPEWDALHLTRTVNDWIDAIQHAVPGASVLFVATHVDQVRGRIKLQKKTVAVQLAPRFLSLFFVFAK